MIYNVCIGLYYEQQWSVTKPECSVFKEVLSVQNQSAQGRFISEME